MEQDLDFTKFVDMDGIVTQQEGEPVHLRQVAGDHVDSTFRVLPMQRVIIGRHESSGIWVDETGVSRRHALIEHQAGVPRLIDLGSTNGTYLNGLRVDNTDLHTGDQIQVGTAVFEVAIGGDGGLPTQPPLPSPEAQQQIAQIHEQLQDGPSGSGEVVIQKTILAGNLENIGLPALLQTLAANRNSGSLIIHDPSGSGRVHLKKGEPIHAKFGRTVGKKALYRLVCLSRGRFEFVAPGFEPDQPTISSQLEGLLLEAMTEFDEFNQYRRELPPDESRLGFSTHHYFVLHRMPADLFQVLACIAQHRTVGAVIDECELSDLSVCRHLLMLLNEKIVVVDDSR